jgi:Arc/MetJ-type ribon-helix-helix transcriptional regulator
MTKKIAVSLPNDTLARAKRVVKSGRAKSVSGYIASLIDREADEESFQAMISRWNREDGRTRNEIEAGEAAALADFERAGLIAKDTRRDKTRRARG